MSPGMMPGTPAPDTGITFREAALRLGISEKTLRARIREGQVEGWTVEGKRGLEWRVRLPEVQDGAREPEPEAREECREEARERDRELELAALGAERDRLADEVTWLRGRVEEASQEAREMRILVARALPDRITPALEANITPPAVEVTPRRVRWWNWWRR